MPTTEPPMIDEVLPDLAACDRALGHNVHAESSMSIAMLAPPESISIHPDEEMMGFCSPRVITLTFREILEHRATFLPRCTITRDHRSLGQIVTLRGLDGADDLASISEEALGNVRSLEALLHETLFNLVRRQVRRLNPMPETGSPGSNPVTWHRWCENRAQRTMEDMLRYVDGPLAAQLQQFLRRPEPLAAPGPIALIEPTDSPIAGVGQEYGRGPADHVQWARELLDRLRQLAPPQLPTRPCPGCEEAVAANAAVEADAPPLPAYDDPREEAYVDKRRLRLQAMPFDDFLRESAALLEKQTR